MTQHKANHKRAQRAVATVASLLALLCAVFYASQESRAQELGVRTISPNNEYRFNFPKTVKQPVLSGVALSGSTLYVGGDDERVYSCPVDGSPADESNVFQPTGQKAEEWVRAIAASPTTGEIAVLTQNGILSVWDVNRNRVARSTSTRIVGAHALSYAPNGKVIAVCGYEAVVHIFDAATLQPITTWRAPGDSSTTVKFSSNGERLAVGGRNGVARVWTTRTPPTVTDLKLTNFSTDGESGALRRVRAIAFSPDNALIAFAGDANQIAVYDVNTSKQVAALVIPADKPSGKIYSLAFAGSTDGQAYVLVSGDSANILRVWDVRSGSCLADSAQSEDGHTGTISSILDDGANVYTTSFDTKVKRWDLTEYIEFAKSSK